MSHTENAQKRREAPFLCAMFGTLLAFNIGCTKAKINQPHAGIPKDAQRAVVAKNVDGDTIWVDQREPGSTRKIRLLEIDAPEVNEKWECFGVEAAAFAEKEIAVGSVIYLAADKEDRDQYARFLRYLWTENGIFYNELAVRKGYARAILIEPNDRYIERIREAEKNAKEEELGLWGAC